MTYEELVAKLKDAYGKYDASKVKEHLAIQFNVRGEADGALYLEVLNGKIYVEPYEYYDRDILVTISAQNLIAIAEGNLDIVDAYNENKLSAEGDLGKALLLKDIVTEKPKQEKTVAQKVGDKVAVAKAVTKAVTSAVKGTASVEKEAEKPAAETASVETASVETKEETTPEETKAEETAPEETTVEETASAETTTAEAASAGAAVTGTKKKNRRRRK